MAAGIMLLGFLGFLATFFFAVAIFLARRRSKFMKHGVRVEGTVVRLSKRSSGTSNQRTIYHPIVEFMDDDGKIRRVTSNTGGDDWDDMLGTPLDVLYLPGRPGTAIVEIDAKLGPRPFILIGCALVAVCGFYLFLYFG